jgi:hypothetical protein
LFTFEFQFEFWGVLPALFYPYGAFLSESKTPPGVPVRALIIEKRVQNLSARVPNRFILRIETEIGLNRSEATSPMFVNKGVAGGGMGSI